MAYATATFWPPCKPYTQTHIHKRHIQLLYSYKIMRADSINAIVVNLSADLDSYLRCETYAQLHWMVNYDLNSVDIITEDKCHDYCPTYEIIHVPSLNSESVPPLDASVASIGFHVTACRNITFTSRFGYVIGSRTWLRELKLVECAHRAM